MSKIRFTPIPSLSEYGFESIVGFPQFTEKGQDKFFAPLEECFSADAKYPMLPLLCMSARIIDDVLNVVGMTGGFISEALS